MSKGWIGVDLDGTLAYYEGWNDGEPGPPIPIMVHRVQKWLEEGKKVKIMTARVSIDDITQRTEQFNKIFKWCRIHIGQELEVTCVKDLSMIELWDDRAVRVVKNTGMIDHQFTGAEQSG